MKIGKKKIGSTATFAIILALYVALVLIIMGLWNLLIPGITHWSSINFWQALGLAVLCRLLCGTMTAKCISFVGNFIGGTQFRDKVNDTDMEGNLLHQFETIMSFFTRNLKTIQVKKEFNSIGQLEIPYT